MTTTTTTTSSTMMIGTDWLYLKPIITWSNYYTTGYIVNKP